MGVQVPCYRNHHPSVVRHVWLVSVAAPSVLLVTGAKVEGSYFGACICRMLPMPGIALWRLMCLPVHTSGRMPDTCWPWRQHGQARAIVTLGTAMWTNSCGDAL